MLDTFNRPLFLRVTIWKCPCSSVIAPCTNDESGSESSTTFTKGIGSPFSSSTVPVKSGVLAKAVTAINTAAIKAVNLIFIFFISFIF